MVQAFKSIAAKTGFYSCPPFFVGAGLYPRPRRVPAQDCHRELPALGGDAAICSINRVQAVQKERIATEGTLIAFLPSNDTF